MNRRAFTTLALAGFLPGIGAMRRAGWPESQRPASGSRATRQLKCVIVGSDGVGKSSMLVSYTLGAFPLKPPRVADNYSADITMADGRVIQLGLWDTAGSPDYDRLRPLTYPQTDVFLVCYSVERQDSFAAVTTKWIPELQRHADKTPCVLVACKADLRANPSPAPLGTPGVPVVTVAQGQTLAGQIGARQFHECSALTGDGLPRLFAESVRVALG